MKTVLALLVCCLFGQVEAAQSEAWYDYQSNNRCTPCNTQRCYSTQCYGEQDTGCDIGSMTPVDNINVSYTFGKGIDTRKNYYSANLMFFPECKVDHKYPFYSLNVHRFSNNQWAGSAGTGLRWRPCHECFIYGVNVFYDVIGAVKGQYNQVGAGLEYLSKDWEAHANGYLPVGRKSHQSLANAFNNYTNGFFVLVKNIEQAWYGADLEVGKNFYYGDLMRFYVGVGTAWFERCYSKDNQWAFKARSFVQFTRFIQLEIRTFKESSSSWHVQGVATLSVPFDCLNTFYTCGFSDIFSQPVVRNAVIRKSKSCCWVTNY